MQMNSYCYMMPMSQNLFDVGMIDDEQSFIDFRFGKDDLYTFLDVFNIPNRVIASQGTACSDIKA